MFHRWILDYPLIRNWREKHAYWIPVAGITKTRWR
jgi:hypothetical protein